MNTFIIHLPIYSSIRMYIELPLYHTNPLSHKIYSNKQKSDMGQDNYMKWFLKFKWMCFDHINSNPFISTPKIWLQGLENPKKKEVSGCHKIECNLFDTTWNDRVFE